MLFNPQHEDRLGRLAHQVRCARTVTPALFADVVEACRRLPALRGAADRIDRLVAAGAWTEAALALVELELPAWKLRRLAVEEGEWTCCLSRQLNLPVELDDTAEGSHELVPLAILSAFIEARRTAAACAPGSSVPRMRTPAGCGICCDNFA
jgi:hypothetical protein